MSVVHLLLYFVCLIASTYGLWLLDLYLKFIYKVEGPNQGEDLYSQEEEEAAKNS